MIRLLQQQNDDIAYLIAVDFARSLNYRRLLRVVFSSQQTSKLTGGFCRPVTSPPENRVVILIS